MRCSVCSHTKRATIEEACAKGATTAAVAARFELSEHSLERHLASHQRAAAPSKKGSPTKRPEAKRRRAPLHQPAEEIAPPTSRSPQSANGTSARGELAELVATIATLLKQAKADKDASYAEKAAVMRTGLAAIRLHAQLTGELGARESALVASPQFRRFKSIVIEILRKAGPNVVQELEQRLEREEIAA